jgi:hypothetical protein
MSMTVEEVLTAALDDEFRGAENRALPERAPDLRLACVHSGSESALRGYEELGRRIPLVSPQGPPLHSADPMREAGELGRVLADMGVDFD